MQLAYCFVSFCAGVSATCAVISFSRWLGEVQRRRRELAAALVRQTALAKAAIEMTERADGSRRTWTQTAGAPVMVAWDPHQYADLGATRFASEHGLTLIDEPYCSDVLTAKPPGHFVVHGAANASIPPAKLLCHLYGTAAAVIAMNPRKFKYMQPPTIWHADKPHAIAAFVLRE